MNSLPRQRGTPADGPDIPGAHEPIISEQLFNHVQALMSERAQETRKPGSSYHHLPYTGILECKECHSNMSPTFTDKKTPEGTRRYHYYRCTSTNHKGWNACTTRQISAARLETTIHQNLARLSRDPFYLKQLIVSAKDQIKDPPENGIEPLQETAPLTPEFLQNELQKHILICARKTGIEKSLSVRQRIEKVYYGKESITARFRLSLPPDGESPLKEVSSSPGSALSPVFPRPPAENSKGSNLIERSDPFNEFETNKMWSTLFGRQPCV